MFVATINVPGYSPMDDDPPVFDYATDAWQWLAEERRRGEDDFADGEEPYSETVDELDAAASAGLIGSVYGGTPGYDGDHDLGLVYSVSIAEEEDD